MANSILKCPFTDLVTLDSESSEKLWTYTIKIKEKIKKLNLVPGNWWDEIITKDTKCIFRSMLLNEEWPVEEETILTPHFIKQILNFGDYPRTYEQKWQHYLANCYKQGGLEYKTLSYNSLDFHVAYAIDSEEYYRILLALIEKNFIDAPNLTQDSDGNFKGKFTLKEKGIQWGKNYNDQKKLQEPKRIPNDKDKPYASIYYMDEEAFYGEILKKNLMDLGFSVIDNKIDSKTFPSLHSARTDFQNPKNSYVVFIKSDRSDKNITFLSLITAAIENHRLTDKHKFKYLFFAFIDRGDPLVPPAADEYLSTFFDFRITTNRARLYKAMLDDWYSRSADKTIKIEPEIDSRVKRYSFPETVLTQDENKWLKIVYERFISGTENHHPNFFPQHWNDFPEDFEPKKIDNLLLKGGSFITFYGIWSIYPTSKYIKGVEDIVFAIKEHLQGHGLTKEITDEFLIQKTNYTIEEINKFLELLNRFEGFMSHFVHTSSTGQSKVVIHEAQLKEYKDFKSLEEAFLNRNYKQFERKEENSADASAKKSKLLNSRIDLDQIDSFRNQYFIKDSHQINPVMGVIELAKDLAYIIQNLKSEKGQMVGIFGRWGRGKSFLLKEIWNEVVKSKETEFIKVEYHAWKYQETPASWAYLYELFSKSYLGERRKFSQKIQYYKRLLKLNYERLGSFELLKFFLTLCGAIATTVIVVVFVDWKFSVPFITIILAGAGSYLKKLYDEFSPNAIDLIKKYSKKHSYKEILGLQADIQEELVKLIKVWIPENKINNKRVLLFVEDIDRCDEEKIIQNVDALRVMLEEVEICKRVVIVAAIDERILKNSIRIKYASLIEKMDSGERDLFNIDELISEYLDKIFISAVKLGEIDSEQRFEYLRELLKDEVDDTTFNEVEKTKNRSKFLAALKLIPENKTFEIDENQVETQNERERIDNFYDQVGESNLDARKQNANTVFKHEGDTVEHGSYVHGVSNESVTEKVTKRVVKQNQFNKLTPHEVSIFSEIVASWSNSTPRKIKIFYYRYILSKNLLINRYQINKRVCPWQNEQGIIILLNQLFKLSSSHASNKISELKSQAVLSTGKEILIDDYEILKEDWIKLLDVFELVIAY